MRKVRAIGSLAEACSARHEAGTNLLCDVVLNSASFMVVASAAYTKCTAVHGRPTPRIMKLTMGAPDQPAAECEMRSSQ